MQLVAIPEQDVDLNPSYICWVPYGIYHIYCLISFKNAESYQYVMAIETKYSNKLK